MIYIFDNSSNLILIELQMTVSFFCFVFKTGCALQESARHEQFLCPLSLRTMQDYISEVRIYVLTYFYFPFRHRYLLSLAVPGKCIMA